MERGFCPREEGGGGGGGLLDPCLGIGVPQIILKTYPEKDNALFFKTLFRTKDNF